MDMDTGWWPGWAAAGPTTGKQHQEREENHMHGPGGRARAHSQWEVARMESAILRELPPHRGLPQSPRVPASGAVSTGQHPHPHPHRHVHANTPLRCTLTLVLKLMHVFTFLLTQLCTSDTRTHVHNHICTHAIHSCPLIHSCIFMCTLSFTLALMFTLNAYTHPRAHAHTHMFMLIPR